MLLATPAGIRRPEENKMSTEDPEKTSELLAVRGLTKAFAGVHALSDVSFGLAQR